MTEIVQAISDLKQRKEKKRKKERKKRKFKVWKDELIWNGYCEVQPLMFGVMFLSEWYQNLQNEPARQSLRCSHTWSIEEGSDQKSDI